MYVHMIFFSNVLFVYIKCHFKNLPFLSFQTSNGIETEFSSNFFCLKDAIITRCTVHIYQKVLNNKNVDSKKKVDMKIIIEYLYNVSLFCNVIFIYFVLYCIVGCRRSFYINVSYLWLSVMTLHDSQSSKTICKKNYKQTSRLKSMSYKFSTILH